MQLNEPDLMLTRMIILGVSTLFIIISTIIFEILSKKTYTYKSATQIGTVVGLVLFILLINWVLGLPFFWYGILAILVYLPIYLLYMRGIKNLAERNKKKYNN
ncbi:MAG: hypothetical protein ACOYVD_17275 [Bacillota bacterium]